MGKDFSISISGCQANGNIIRNVMETSVLCLELGLPRQRYISRVNWSHRKFPLFSRTPGVQLSAAGLFLPVMLFQE